jgi:hypothetical protein
LHILNGFRYEFGSRFSVWSELRASLGQGIPCQEVLQALLLYDVARRFAQPLGIHLDKWEGRIIETEKGVVRLLPVGERATQLFGESDASAMAHRIEQDVRDSRNYAFAFMHDVAAPPEIRPRGRGKAKATGATI